MNSLLALLCVSLFSLTVPTTRIATQVFDPIAVTLFRLIGAGVVCAVSIGFFDRWVPPRRIWGGLIATSIGSVCGFSILIALAMKRVPGIHGAIALAALPAVTAVYASLRDGKNPGLRFWSFCALGTTLSFGFLLSRSGQGLRAGDWLLAGAVLTSAFGYVEGGRLSRQHGGKRVMSWAILLTFPFAVAVGAWLLRGSVIPLPGESPAAWASVAYLALISQSLGMFLWFTVLARGPMARVALVQLVQPFLSILASVLLLGETASPGTWVIAALIALSVFGANQARETMMSENGESRGLSRG